LRNLPVAAHSPILHLFSHVHILSSLPLPPSAQHALGACDLARRRSVLSTALPSLASLPCARQLLRELSYEAKKPKSTLCEPLREALAHLSAGRDLGQGACILGRFRSLLWLQFLSLRSILSIRVSSTLLASCALEQPRRYTAIGQLERESKIIVQSAQICASRRSRVVSWHYTGHSRASPSLRIIYTPPSTRSLFPTALRSAALKAYTVSRWLYLHIHPSWQCVTQIRPVPWILVPFL
jgi:hypothetical protein